jgi:hypothetical protein
MRFSSDDLALLAGAEQLAGRALSRTHQAPALRDALALMRAGRKLAVADRQVALTEAEVVALLQALRRASNYLERYHDHVLGWKGSQPLGAEEQAWVEEAFPTTRASAWTASRLVRDLKALAE